MPQDRYQRQSLVTQIGPAGQAKLSAARVLIVGMGALGCTIADQLARAGAGMMRIVDRDVVEWTNLQRQTLYDESDAKRGIPKVEAAARRLRTLRSDLTIEPHAVDVDASNIESLTGGFQGFDVILDGSDNAELRYLINDVSVKLGMPWVMGGCIGVEGRVVAFEPPGMGTVAPHVSKRDQRGDPVGWNSMKYPCLRCVFPTPPAAGELATCDTAGALGPAIGVVASLQVAEAMKLIVGDPSAATTLTTLDVWTSRFHSIDLKTARRDDCPCCGLRKFEFLDRPASGGAKLCGRNAVQIRPPSPTRLDLAALAKRLAPVALIETTQLTVSVAPRDRKDLTLRIFADGRAIVMGTADVATARAIYARLVGV